VSDREIRCDIIFRSHITFDDRNKFEEIFFVFEDYSFFNSSVINMVVPSGKVFSDSIFMWHI